MDRHNGDNIGGFHTLYIAKVKDLTSHNFDAQKFEQIYFTNQTGKWDRKTKASKNGNYFEHQLVFDVPKYRKEVETYLSEVNEVALIAYIVLVNGEFVRIGSLGSPLFILADVDGGKNYADFNSYSFKGSATEAINMAKNIAIIATPPPPPPPPPPLLPSGLKVEAIPGKGRITVSGAPLNIDEQSMSIIFRGNFHLFTMYLRYLVFLEITCDATGIYTFQSNPYVQVPRVNFYNFYPLANTVYAFVITRKGEVEKVYINGNLIGTNICATWGYNGGITFTSQSTTEYYDIKGYNRELTPTEIMAIATSEGAISPTGAYFDIPFTESTGDVAYDISPNNLHMTLTADFWANQPELQPGPLNHHIYRNGNPVL